MSASLWREAKAVSGRIAVALSVLALVPASAALAQAGKVAVIDVQRLVTDSVAGKEALARLKKLQDDKIAEGKAKNEEVDNLRKRLNEGRLSLADDKISELEKQLEEKVTGLRRFQEDAERDFNKSRETTFGEIERRVFPVIEQIGKEGGYAFIFNKFQSGLLYADEAADITNQVIQRFDGAATPKGN
ncbi:MAG: OmpH family outer membrane protein [Thermoanaerobaculia bacterium]|nr:OmpH family outer membrane protein [Thermoanaerobaculia bacterium]MBP9825298.1 OmpH family outer membrane protein [Thermoanaerobaculia bacterium]